VPRRSRHHFAFAARNPEARLRTLEEPIARFPKSKRSLAMTLRRILLLAALCLLALPLASAQAGVRIGIGIGVPVYRPYYRYHYRPYVVVAPRPVVVAPAPVNVAPVPVYATSAPVYVAPAPAPVPVR
jgi:hypothetical protein